ncbi:MAG: hypothetical protein JNK25_08685 [Phycisphaerae bacterium]|nr:hypothetical protein [Phycisphaerae bacterium]
MLMLVAVVAGCVTERVTHLPGTPVRPASKSGGSTTEASAAKTRVESPAKLPDGPVAQPAKGTTIATDVLVEVQTFGRVSYDGQALPIAAPDGEYIAVQEGTPPSWSTILAEPEATIPESTRLTIYAASKPPLKAVRPAEPLPAGLVLGRGADSRGVLVELPRSGGVRWIGRVNWATASLEYLVRGQECNAHAVYDVTGNLIFTRRATGSTSTALVLRTPDGRESIKEPLDGTYAYPCVAMTLDVVYVFRLSRAGTELDCIRVDRSDPTAPRLADTRQTWRISTQADLLMAHQIASTAAPVWPLTAAMLPGLEGSDFDVLTAFDPRRARMVRFNWHTGGVEALVHQSIAACHVTSSGRAGYFCTAPQGLVFLPRPADGWPPSLPENAPQARVLDTSYVPTALRGDTSIFVLVGPVKGSSNMIEIVKMAIANR